MEGKAATIAANAPPVKEEKRPSRSREKTKAENLLRYMLNSQCADINKVHHADVDGGMPVAGGGRVHEPGPVAVLQLQQRGTPARRTRKVAEVAG